MDRYKKLKTYAALFKNFSLKDSSILVKQLVCFFIITIIPVWIISYIWFKTTTSILEEYAIQSSSQIINQVSQNMKNSIEEVNNISLSILFDLEINQLLDVKPNSIEEKLVLQSNLNERLIRTANISKKISSIVIIGKEFSSSSTTSHTDYDALKEHDWYKSFVNTGAKKVFTKAHYNDYFSDLSIGNKPVFSLVRAIISPENGERLGVLVIDIKYEVIDEILSELQINNNNTFFLYDIYGEMVYHPDLGRLFDNIYDEKQLFGFFTGPEGVTSARFAGKDSLIQYSTIPYTNWKIVNVIPRDILMQKSFELRRQTQIVGIVFIVLVVLMAAYTSVYISTPITRMAKVVKKVELGDLSVRVAVDSKDEVGQLGMAFNNMLSQINNLMKKVYQEENKKREAELKALQAQINPHFLYNTLNTIRWMAVIQKAESISNMIVSLIKLLEFSGKRIGEFVTIAQEVEHAKNYIFLQKIRYNDKFIVHYDIDERLLHYKTIKLILQPIIENAIFHGIEPKGGIGTIHITLCRINDKLKFEIADDGIGMDIHVDKDRKFSGLGIENVNERLVRYFGEQSGLKIDSSINKGTKVMFYLPIINHEGMCENA